MVENLCPTERILGVARYKITPAFKHVGVLYLVSFQHDSEFSIVNRSWLNPDLLLSYCHHPLTELLFFFH